MKQTTLYKKALKKWGQEAQLQMIQEECAELIQAVSKILRKGDQPHLIMNLAEELADVEIMIEQAELMFDWRMLKELKDQMKDRKLGRLAELLVKDE